MFKKTVADISINSLYIAIPGLVAAGVVTAGIYWVVIPGVVISKLLLDDNKREVIFRASRKIQRGLCKVDGTTEFENRMFS